jgi:ankyrin repeat protein
MLIESGADVAAQNKDGETPLHRASRPDLYDFQVQGLAEVSRMLLAQGADVNARNKDGLTPFCLASQCAHARDRRARVLLQHGADFGDGVGGYLSSDISDSDSGLEMDLED